MSHSCPYVCTCEEYGTELCDWCAEGCPELDFAKGEREVVNASAVPLIDYLARQLSQIEIDLKATRETLARFRSLPAGHMQRELQKETVKNNEALAVFAEWWWAQQQWRTKT
jgi:hypothetical protein